MNNVSLVVLIKPLIFLLIFLSIFNYRIFSLGPGDFLLIFTLSYVFFVKRDFQFNAIDLYFLLFLGCLYFLSGISQFFYGTEKIFEFMGFAYKYLVVFLIVLLARNIDISMPSLIKILTFVWVILAGWTIYYAFFRLNSIYAILIPGQISFPGTGSNSNLNADSHLFAYVVGFLGLFLTLFSPKYKSLIFLVTLFCVVLTGSRNPLLLYLLVLVTSFLLTLNIKDFAKIFGIFFTFAIIGYIIFVYFDVIEEFLPTVRSFQISFDDVSALNRVKKFIAALEGVDNSFLFLGESILRSNLFWTDGIHSILIVHFGFFGLAAFLIWLIFYFVSVRKIEIRIQTNNALSLLSIYALLGLFITEFILVTRGAILVFLPLSICYFQLYKDMKEFNAHESTSN